MTGEKYDPNCPDCRPVLLNGLTGQPLPPDHPVMQIVNEVWEASPLEEREAWWKVTVKNSRLALDVQMALALTKRIQDKMPKEEHHCNNCGCCDSKDMN